MVNIILPSKPGSPKWSLSLNFPHQNPVYASHLPYTRTSPAHLILPHFVTGTILGEQCRSLSSSLCSFLHPLVTSSLLVPNILLNTSFSEALSLLSFLNMSDQVSHPYKTTCKIIVLYQIFYMVFLIVYPNTTGITCRKIVNESVELWKPV